MALVNQAMHEINAKIVYFGPGLSGKASSLKFIYGKLKAEFRGKFKSMNVQGGKMLFFDFTPPGEGKVRGYRVRLHLYTISGEGVESAAWKVALKGADGIVFVADSSSERVAENSRSLEELESLLDAYDLSLASKPMVFQYNKNDLGEAVSKEDLDRVLNPSAFPSVTASSESGAGVLQALLALVKSVLLELRQQETLPGEGEPAEEPAVATPAAAAEEAGLSPASAPAAASVAGGEGQPGEAAPGAPAVPSPLSGVSAVPGAATEEEPLSVELSAGVTVGGDGRVSLPLTIRSGARSRSVVLNLTVTLDQG